MLVGWPNISPPTMTVNQPYQPYANDGPSIVCLHSSLIHSRLLIYMLENSGLGSKNFNLFIYSSDTYTTLPANYSFKTAASHHQEVQEVTDHLTEKHFFLLLLFLLRSKTPIRLTSRTVIFLYLFWPFDILLYFLTIPVHLVIKVL